LTTLAIELGDGDVRVSAAPPANRSGASRASGPDRNLGFRLDQHTSADQVSYSELEHETADHREMPRLVFLLGEDTEGPAALFADLEHAARQQAFRVRLANSGVTTATVTSPAELETAVLQALTALPRPD
jgi:hypothetical protein